MWYMADGDDEELLDDGDWYGVDCFAVQEVAQYLGEEEIDDELMAEAWEALGLPQWGDVVDGYLSGYEEGDGPLL